MPDFAAIARCIEPVAPVPSGRPEPVGGGCIHPAFRWGGYFIKTNTRDQVDNFGAETEGLRILGSSGAIRVPEVLTHGDSGRDAFLVLEWLDLRGQGDEARLGENLARLHQVTADRYGFPKDNFIGATAQPNGWHDDWPSFFRDHRIGHLLRLLEGKGITFPEAPAFLEGLPGILPPNPPRALLHGDLWSGNKAFLPDGTPAIFDPAAYHGDPECDLAMTHLFGGFGARFYEAYRSILPAPADEPTLHEIYNLYHLLNHALLFGGGYVSQARGVLRRFV